MQSNGLKDTSLKQKTKILQPQSQKQFETIGECTMYNVNVYCTQGWEFAHRFSKRITRFLPKNERMSN